MERRKRKKKFMETRPLVKILLLVAFVFLIVLVVYQYQNRKPQIYEILQRIDIKASDYSHEIYDGGVLVFEENHLKLYRDEKIQLDIERPGIKTPEIISLEESIFLIDKESGNIEVFNKKGESIHKFSINQPIEDMKKDIHSQAIGFHIKEANNVEEIIFCDQQGQIIGKTGKLENGKIIDYAFNQEEDKLFFSAIEYKKNLINNLVVMNMNQKILSGKIFKDEIVLKAFIGKNKENIYATLNKIYVYDENNQLKWERGIQMDKIDYNYTLDKIILCQEKPDKTQVLLIDRQNNILFEGAVNGKIQKIVSNEAGTLLHGQRTLAIIQGESIQEIKLNKDISWANLIKKDIIVIGNNKYIEIIKIFPNKLF